MSFVLDRRACEMPFRGLDALMKAWIGTSGFQYPEWKGKFYPADMSAARMLAYYAGTFASTEINYTFRSIPSERTIDRWCGETPAQFRFSLKAPQRVTHFAKLRDCGEILSRFHEAVTGLAKKFGPVLFQLPPTFKCDTALLREFTDSIPKGMRAAFEFRHESWLTEKVFEILAKRNVALCNAESEEFETPPVATANFGYLRPRKPDYSTAGIRKRAKFVQEQSNQWKEVFAYFKHEETCAGPAFAKAFMKALS
jgi:uncharacterized protein YecE (DUF72 family)